MNVTATALVNWHAIWKILVAALIGGPGVVVVFGMLLFGLKRAAAAKNAERRVANYALSGVCGLLCIGAAVVGIYAMAEKPASKAKKASKSAAVVGGHQASADTRLTASAP